MDNHILQVSADGVIVLVVAFLLYIAWYDFKHLTILNRDILLLLALYAAWSGLTGFATIAGDLGAGMVLFLMGLVLWLLRMMGAGDVKLYFGLGLFMGLPGIGAFAILLLAVTLAFLGASVFATRSTTREGVIGRLRTIRETGKAPYAVLMCAAAIPAILMRSFGSG